MKASTRITEDQRNALFATMREVGAYQCEQQESAAKTATRKADGSIVTHVDPQSQQRIIATLQGFTPTYPIIAEEARGGSANEAAIQSNGPVWVIDPLDGTKSYVEGYHEFGINVALLSAPDTSGNRTAEFGAVYFPAKREMYFTNTHGTSTMEQYGEDGSIIATQPLRCRSDAKETAPLKIAIGYNDNGLRHFAESGHILAHSRHTAGYRTARLLKDDYHVASFDAPVAIWDIAALAALVRGANGHMFSLHANGSVSDTPYFGADASRYHHGVLFANPPYLCMHEDMLHELDSTYPVIRERAGHQR